MMNFRQRMGWLGVTLYLLFSILAIYYVFDVHTLHLERVQRGGVGQPAPSPVVTWSHVQSFPFWLWASVFLLPYLQLFLFLFSCTRTDPRAVGYCVIPVCIALLCSRRHATGTATNHKAGSVIDT